MDLGIDDFKQLLFDLYITQRENAELRFKLNELLKAQDAGPAYTDEEG